MSNVKSHILNIPFVRLLNYKMNKILHKLFVCSCKKSHQKYMTFNINYWDPIDVLLQSIFSGFFSILQITRKEHILCVLHQSMKNIKELNINKWGFCMNFNVGVTC